MPVSIRTQAVQIVEIVKEIRITKAPQLNSLQIQRGWRKIENTKKSKENTIYLARFARAAELSEVI